MTLAATEAPARNGRLADATGRHAAGHLVAAEAGYRGLIQADPGDSEALYYLGVVAYQRGLLDHASELCRFALSSPRFSSAFEPTLARILKAQGLAAEAEIRTFLRSSRLEPHILSGKLGGVLDATEIEPWSFARPRNGYPRRAADFDDLEGLIDAYVLEGWSPEPKPFGAESRLLALGACFAKGLRKHLVERQRHARLIYAPSGLSNTFALRQFIDWSLTGNAATDAYAYDEQAFGDAVEWMPEQEQLAYRSAFTRADGILLTVGLAEVWYDRETGGVFWRGVPRGIFDDKTHVCRVSSVEENATNIRAIIRMIRWHCGAAPVVLALSPAPLQASFGDAACVTVDCVSKSILRVAIDQVMAEGFENVHYWPAFEIVKWIGCHLAASVYGDDGDECQLSPATVRLIADAFMRHYFAADTETAP